MSALDVSKQTVVNYKRKLEESQQQPSKRSKTSSHPHTSITPYNQSQILEYNQQNPFDKPKEIKRELRLDCSDNTVMNVLSKSDVKCYIAVTQPLINAVRFDLKKRWAIIMNKLNQSDWNQIVFSDEKTLQNFNNGKIKVYRKRNEASVDHVYRKTLNRFKINLFGYITSRGLGNLYVFDDILDSDKYINYMHHDVPPDVIKDVGPSSHVSKKSIDYFEKINANLLIWPPACPDLNIMENVWSQSKILYVENI